MDKISTIRTWLEKILETFSTAPTVPTWVTASTVLSSKRILKTICLIFRCENKELLNVINIVFPYVIRHAM